MIRQLVIAGDSLAQGSNLLIGQGGQGTWAELVAERLANIAGIGPLLSAGLRGCHLGFVGTPIEWSFTSGADAWTTVVSTDAWDKYPYGGSGFTGSKYANGSTKTATWTRSTKNRPVVGFAFYWIDYTNGGNWSYRIDGGAWIAMGQTIANDNGLKKFYVATAVTSTVEIRAANAAGTGVGCCPVGVEPFYSTATDGLIVHNIAISGSKLHELTLATSGDRMAIFDLIAPNAGVINLCINDILLANTTTWATDLTALNTRVGPLGPVGFISPYGVSTGSYNDTQQTDYRAQTVTTAAGFGTPAKVLSVFDAWNANGWGSTNALQSSIGITDGRLTGDGIHPSQLGHFDLATRVYWFVRTQFFDLGASGNAFKVGSSTVGGPTVLGGTSGLFLPAGTAVAVTAGTAVLKATNVVAPTGKTIAVTIGVPALVPGAVASAPTGFAVGVIAGTPALQATNLIAATGQVVAVTAGAPSIVPGQVTTTTTGKTIAVTAGTPLVKTTNTIVPTGTTVTVATGSPVLTAANTISPTGHPVAVVPGDSAVAPMGTIAITGVPIAVTAGTPTILAGGVTAAITGHVVTITAGTAVLRATNVIAATGHPIAVTAGTPALKASNVIVATGKVIVVAAGTASVLAAGAVTVSGHQITVTAGVPTIAASYRIQPSGHVITTTAGAPTVTAPLVAAPSGVVVSVTVGTVTILGGVGEPTSAALTVLSAPSVTVTKVPVPTATVAVKPRPTATVSVV